MSKITIELPANIINNISASLVCQSTQNALQTSLEAITTRWQQEARKKLKSTLPEYLLGLDAANSIVYPYNGNSMSGAVILRGKFPNMLEQGYAPYDMKSGFSKSGRKHKKKDGGWYMNIPFRHGTPNSFMYGTPMPKNIYAQAKRLGHRQSLQINGEQRTSWTGYRHKNNIQDGLTRIVKQYESGKKQSEYMTFRRVSDTSDPTSWQHPGFKGVKIADSLQHYAADVFKNCFEMSLAGIQK